MDIIKIMREEEALKQNDLANILGIKRPTYSSYETKRDPIPLKHLNTLCNYFKISLDYALGLTTKKQYKNNRLNIDRNLLKIRLRALRKEQKLTQKQMAELLNTSRSTWTGYEYGKYQITTELLFFLAQKFHYSMDYLTGKIDIDYIHNK